MCASTRHPPHLIRTANGVLKGDTDKYSRTGNVRILRTHLCGEHGPVEVAGVPQARALVIAAGADDVLLVWAALDAAHPGRMRPPKRQPKDRK